MSTFVISTSVDEVDTDGEYVRTHNPRDIAAFDTLDQANAYVDRLISTPAYGQDVE